MNDIQKHLIELLLEIDAICADNDIPYLLGGRTAKDACQSHCFVGDYVYATVMMRDWDFNKFRKAVEKKDGRAVESLLENPDYPDGQSMRYVDLNTTFLYGQTAHRYRYKGIYVTIQKCRRVPKNKMKAKLANAIDTTVCAIGSDDLSGSGAKKLATLMLRAAIKVLGKPRLIRLLLKVQRKLIRGGKTLALLRVGKPHIGLSKSMFTNAQRVELEGAAFYVPVDDDTYLKKVYGKNWMIDDKPEPITSPHLLVCSTQVSYKEIDNDDTLYANRAQVDAVIEKRKKLNGNIQVLRSRIEAYWNLLFLTKERYELYRKYVPVLPELQENLSKKDYAWLNVALADYIEVLRTYLDKQLPLVIHPELDAVVMEVLKYQGAHGLVQACGELKKKKAFRAIHLALDDAARVAALHRLPAAVAVEGNGVVPAYVRCGGRLLRVALPDEEGHPGPVLICRESAILPADGVTAQTLLVQTENGAYVPFFSHRPCKRLFADMRAIPLVQCVYEKDRELAWLDEGGRLYVTAAVDADGLYESVALPQYIAVADDKSVPLYFYDEACATLRRTFCLDAAGHRIPVATLGLGGVLWMTPGVAESLHFEDDNGEAQPLTAACFADAATDGVHRALGRTAAPVVCCPLVQEDAFGRRIEVAALYTDGRVLPLVRVDADGTPVALEPNKPDYATICLKQTDGTDIPLVSVDAAGTVVYAANGQTLPVQAIIDGMKA